MSAFLFESKRLGFRELCADDTRALFEILSDPETMKYYPRPYSYEESRAWLKRSKESYQTHQFGLWALILKAEDRFIGQCGIAYQMIDGTRVPEIAYHINKHYWNRGLGTEASQLCLNKGFDRFGLDEIFIHTWVENKPSRRIAVKLGMIQHKVYDKAITEPQTVLPHVVYSMRKNPN